MLRLTTNSLKLIFFALVFFSCKKYQENTLWFKNPEKVILGDYNITEYYVDKIDCLSYISNKVKTDITLVDWHFTEGDHKTSDKEIFARQTPGEYAFTNRKKGLRITFYDRDFDTTYHPEIVYTFLETTTYWDILELKKIHNKPVLKIKRNSNGKEYIIRFN